MVNKKGFTLIELIIVLAILAVLASIATVTAHGSIKRAEFSAASATLHNIESVIRVSTQFLQMDVWPSSNEENHFYYQKGSFKYLPGSTHSPYGDLLLKAFNDSALSATDTTYLNIRMNYYTATNETKFIIIYSNKSGDLSKIYYMLDSVDYEVKVYND